MLDESGHSCPMHVLQAWIDKGQFQQCGLVAANRWQAHSVN